MGQKQYFAYAVMTSFLDIYTPYNLSGLLCIHNIFYLLLSFPWLCRNLVTFSERKSTSPTWPLRILPLSLHLSILRFFLSFLSLETKPTACRGKYWLRLLYFVLFTVHLPGCQLSACLVLWPYVISLHLRHFWHWGERLFAIDKFAGY